jgi:hypothetical protein
MTFGIPCRGTKPGGVRDGLLKREVQQMRDNRADCGPDPGPLMAYVRNWERVNAPFEMSSPEPPMLFMPSIEHSRPVLPKGRFGAWKLQPFA